LLFLLFAFPSALFNETLEENYDRIAAWFHRGGRVGAALRARLARFWTGYVGVAVFLALSGVIYGFLDPGFGLDAESAVLFGGIVVGLLLTTVAFEAPLALFQKRHNGELGVIRVLPLSIVVAIVCVLLSRVANFQPGYLYGLVAFYAFTRGMSPRQEGIAVAATCLLILVLAVSAWVALPLADAALAGQPLAQLFATTVLAAIFVGGLEGVLFELFPMRFLRGSRLWAWSRVAWAILFVAAAFAFVHVLLAPTAGYLFETSAGAVVVVVGFLIGFAALSIAFWAYFRFRPTVKPVAPETS
jgi:hypothetical protein